MTNLPITPKKDFRAPITRERCLGKLLTHALTEAVSQTLWIQKAKTTEKSGHNDKEKKKARWLTAPQPMRALIKSPPQGEIVSELVITMYSKIKPARISARAPAAVGRGPIRSAIGPESPKKKGMNNSRDNEEEI